ncbi:response regulator [Actinomadura sp. GTD37]|uniref:response regulator n=1 Tax=Actinomadura sp. GTD37 TaxID=1778030 RepID=UPI0035BF1753
MTEARSGGGERMNGGAGRGFSVLVVDDDFRVAEVHAGYVKSVPGFRVAGQAGSAAEARALAAELRPDLVLLDIYLPDESGLSLLGRLDADVILATAAADAESVRTALSRGVHHYLVKPFTGADLAERLTAYARFRRRLAVSRELSQPDIDGALRTLHGGQQQTDPDGGGRVQVTSRLVLEALERAGGPRSAAEIGAEIGISRTTAQRYLASLAQAGKAQVTLRYGSTGRPEHQYVHHPD